MSARVRRTLVHAAIAGCVLLGAAPSPAEVSARPNAVRRLDDLLQGFRAKSALALNKDQRLALDRVKSGWCSGKADEKSTRALLKATITPKSAERALAWSRYIAFETRACSQPALPKLLTWLDGALTRSRQARSHLGCGSASPASDLSGGLSEAAAPCEPTETGDALKQHLLELKVVQKELALVATVLGSNAAGSASQSTVQQLADGSGSSFDALIALFLKLQQTDPGGSTGGSSGSSSSCASIQAAIDQENLAMLRAQKDCMQGDQAGCATAVDHLVQIGYLQVALEHC